MYMDKKLEFCGASQTVTVSAASTDSLDLGGPGAHGGNQIAIQVKETATAAGAATVEVVVQQSATEDFAVVENVGSTGAIGKADLTEGKLIYLPMSPQVTKQFIRLYFNVGTGPLTAGKFAAGIVEGPQINVPTKAQQ